MENLYDHVWVELESMIISLDLRPFILNTDLICFWMDYLGTGRKETNHYIEIFSTKVNNLLTISLQLVKSSSPNTMLRFSFTAKF